MRRMGNSGKLAVISAVMAGALLVLAAVTLEEWVLFTFFGVVVLGYMASLWQVFARRRYLVLALACVASILFIAFGIAFLRMWGLAFTLSENSLGSAVSSKDSDIYFYLSVAAGCVSLLLLFLGAVWPGRKAAAARRPGTPAAKRPASRAAQRPAAAPARRPASSSRSSRPVPRQSSPRTPARRR